MSTTGELALPGRSSLFRRGCGVNLKTFEAASAGERASCLFPNGPLATVASGVFWVWDATAELVRWDAGWQRALPT